MADPYAAYGASVDQTPKPDDSQSAPVSQPDTSTAAPANDPYAQISEPAQAGPAAQSDQPAPDGFTDDQKRAILDYIPKAKDAADLEQFSREISGGHAHVGNAQEILDRVKKGHRPDDFSWAPPKVGAAEKPPEIKVNALGGAVKTALDAILPGMGTAVTAVAPGSVNAYGDHLGNALAGDYGPEVAGFAKTLLSPDQYTDFKANFDRNVAHNHATLSSDSEQHPIASTAGELTGITGEGMAGGAVADAANLGKFARGAQLTTEGAVYGSGAAGPGNRAEGAAIGAVAAPALAVAGKVAGAAINSGKSVLEGTPGLARRIISKAIKQDMNTAESVGQTIADAHANDVPMALGDTGENVRGLMAASSRASGVGRTVVRDALEERQSALADRVTGHIERDLGPIANPNKVADTLMTKANTDAAPLYASAYAKPGAPEFSEKVAPLLQRPSMKKALAYAYRTAQEEGRDPETLGLEVAGNRTTSILDANGNHIEVPEVTLTKTPSWQTLDYVKRGADDLVESYKNKITGEYNFDTEGRAANNTLRTYLGAFDAANPDYAAARAAYAGPVKGISAMNTGRKFLNMNADDIEAQMRDMSPFEKQMAALGTRRAMAELVQSKGDTADVVNALVGTGKKRAMLARLFGDRQQFSRFVDTLGQEREGWRSFRQALLGSPTAANAQDDVALQGAALAADMVANGGVPVTYATSKAVKFLGGKLGEKAKQQIAALLSNTDPAAIRELAAELRAKAEQRGLHVGRIRTATGITGKGAAVALQPQQSQ